MSENSKALESCMSHLCQEAKDLGAAQAVPIQAAEIVIDERTLLKCMVPVCSHYGTDLMCPPNVLSVSQFREILGRYQAASLIKVDIPPDEMPVPGTGKNEKPDEPKPEYVNAARDSQKKLHEIICRLESLCMAEGYPFAAGLIGGSCPLCDECVGVKSGLPCRYPFKARPAMEAMGIDVIATAKKVGLHVGFGQNEGRGWVGLVLVG